jgi:CDP-diglyceride synthetase
MSTPRRPGDDDHDYDDQGDERDRTRRRVPPRGRRREARFELDFGSYEPSDRGTGSRDDRTGSRDDRTGTRDGGRTRGTISGTYDPVEPLPRRRRPRAGEPLPDDSGTYDVRLEDRDRRARRRVSEVEERSARPARDDVAGEIEALERFEDAIETVRSPSNRGGGSDLGARVLVAVPAAVVAVLLVAAGGPVFAVGIAAFGLVGAWELTRMFAKTRPSLFATGLGITAIIAAAALGDGSREPMLTAFVAMVPIVFLSVALSHPKGSMPGVAVTMLGIGWIGLALGHAILLRESEHGAGIVVDVLIGVFLGDTGAYLGGRLFGNRKLWPRVSPNKTIEGLLIGVVVAVASVWFAGLYQDWLSGTDALLIGLAVAVIAPLGDLFESFLKRDAGTKDAGGLFGVHGGVLDRLDAAMFGIVAGYYVWLAMGMA